MFTIRSFRAGTMLAATLLATIFQLGWPVALAMHQHLEHSHTHVAAHDQHDPHDSNPSSDSHHAHDSSHCPTCQAIAQLRSVDLPTHAATVIFALIQQPAANPASQAVAACPSLSSAAPRAPPLA